LFRYLAFIWHDEDEAARATARRLIERHCANSSEWRIALRKKGLFVGYAGARVGSMQAHCLQDNAGVVLGRLFERSGNSPSTSVPLELDESRTRSITESQGRRLVDGYWGRYVAVLNDQATQTTSIVRDPSGGLNCLNLRFGGVRLYFSAMADIQHLGLGPFDVNWTYLSSWICMMRGQTHATALTGVSQVLPGECVQVRADGASSRFYWDLLQIAGSNVIEDPEEATRAMRDRVMDCVRAWASCYNGITLSVSGGLDSSVVYAALKDTPAKDKLTCFHFYPLGTDMDERRFARRVTESGGSQLIERPRSPQVSLRSLLEIEASHEPILYLGALEHSRLNAALAAKHKATACFNGEGGDQLFYQSPARLAAGDYLHHRGLGLQFFQVALDCAHADRISVWRVLGDAFTHQVQGRRWSFRGAIEAGRPLIRREVFADAYGDAVYTHPLLNDDRNTPDGKLWHALALSAPVNCRDPLGRPDDPENIAPLFSQPVLELCLRLPVHVLTVGGWDRAIARRAFYAELPREVAHRKYKGTIEAHIRGIIDSNLTFVREMLLGGALIQADVVDPKELSKVLSGKVIRTQSNATEILDLLGTEAWLRRWSNQGWRAAA
jgi:asparagine synthase (glutamine-hydrolysing)